MSFQFNAPSPLISQHQSSAPSNGLDQYQLPNGHGNLDDSDRGRAHSPAGFPTSEPCRALSNYNGPTTNYNQGAANPYSNQNFMSTPSNCASDASMNSMHYGSNNSFDLPFSTVPATLSICDKDTLRNKHKLNPEQVKLLKRHIHYNSDGNIGAVKSSMVIHGLLLNIDNKLEVQRLEGKSVKELVNNANKLAKTTVNVSEELKHSFIDPNITSYTTASVVHTIMGILRAHSTDLGCKDIIAKPLGETALKVVAKASINSASQQLRTLLIASVFGEDSKTRKKAKDPLTLEAFSHQMIDKWSSGGLGSITGKKYQLWFAMMCVWLLDLGKDRALSTADSEEPEPESTQESTSATPLGSAQLEEPPTKKRCVGKTSQDNAFWPMFTAFMQEKVALWGEDIKLNGWPNFLGECVMKDWKHFGKNEHRLPVLSLELAVGATPGSGTDVQDQVWFQAGAMMRIYLKENLGSVVIHASHTTDADETMVDYDSDIMSDDLSKPDHELLLRSLRDAEERNKSLLAQALALKELNENLEKEVNCLKVNYNKLDDECADLWREQLLEKREPLVHHRNPSPTSVPVNFGFEMQAYLDSIDCVIERESCGGFISVKEKILSEEEKLELRVKRVLLAKDVMDGKGCG
ncbi:hypothetical protein BT96DRAFT_947654 [Gymnopus androsaceus JB14]|uniref:Uncharacterized protein n=1 Tax=Gymnopus androsaceus JB14 TaxID=1447944 RepID=A0A6A4GRG0_9AGAR|nr:hypothetical protein BT96DRAFT_947654 [Gymnopus androsaceus JB14]